MLGERLAAARKQAGLTQVELAAIMGPRYNGQMISMVENNHSGLLMDGAIKAARELKVSLDYLVGLSDDPTPATEQEVNNPMLGERLAAARRRAGLAQIELAAALGPRYDQTMISAVERGRANMLFDGAVKTARALHVSLDYLAGLTDDPRPAAALAAAEEDTVSSNGQAGQRDIPILEIAAAAGGGATVFDETVTGHVSFQRSWLDRHGIAPQHSVIIGVSGESMEPTLPDGCSILVDRSRRQPQEGHIYVLRTDEGLVVKRLRRDEAGQWQLQSEHPGWPAVPLASTAEVIGEVRWVARTL